MIAQAEVGGKVCVPKQELGNEKTIKIRNPPLTISRSRRSNHVKTTATFAGRGVLMKKKGGILALVVALSLIAGCATENYNPYMLPGAGIGAALGAGIGAAANHSNPWRGAAIGALLGGAGGAVGGELYGRSKPYPYPPYPQQQQGYSQPAPAPAPAPQPGYSYTPTPPSYN
jgi:hypothetical protein